MGDLYKKTKDYITRIDTNSIFVEIGSDNGEGSTLYFANLAEQYGTVLHTVDARSGLQNLIQHPSIIWHTAIGSTWTERVWPTINKPISLLYLDNFDFIWDSDRTDSSPGSVLTETNYLKLKGKDWPEQYVDYESLPDFVKTELIETFDVSYDSMMKTITTQYQKIGFKFTNTECQIEHFKQFFNLYSSLSENCTIILDDTYTVNDCWTGKSGPIVVMLLALEFNIVEIKKLDPPGQTARSSPGVILQRGNC